MKYILPILCLCASICASNVAAAEISSAEKKNVAAALDKVSKAMDRKFEVTDIKPTPIPWILEVTSDYNVFYVTADGKYIISGDLIDLTKDKRNWSLTENAMRDLRKQAMAGLDPNAMIIFPATAPKIGTVDVFTDIDCAYCRKMQSEISEYNAKGIEVRYIAFPRTGPNTPSFEKAITVWCSKDKQGDLTLAKQGKDLPKNLCSKNPVLSDFELGRKLGVNGTPTLIFEDGSKVPGYLTPEQMEQYIKEEVQH